MHDYDDEDADTVATGAVEAKPMKPTKPLKVKARVAILEDSVCILGGQLKDVYGAIRQNADHVRSDSSNFATEMDVRMRAVERTSRVSIVDMTDAVRAMQVAVNGPTYGQRIVRELKRLSIVIPGWALTIAVSTWVAVKILFVCAVIK